MLDNLSLFGFRAMWSPYFLIFTILLAAVYLYFTVGKGKEKYFGNVEKVGRKQLVLFLSGVVLLYIVVGSPVDLLSHLNFSFHMIQMALLYLTVPPLLILGSPEWLLKKIVDIKLVRKTLNFFTKPVIALIMFNGLFSFYHWPSIFDTVKQSFVLHTLYLIILFFAAFCMWWPLLNPIKDEKGLSGLQKIGYLLADGAMLTPACALIIFSPVAVYATYTDPASWARALELCVPISTLSGMDLSQPQMFSFLPPRDDQQLGGVLMKVIQEIMYGSILAYNFFKWYKEQRAQDEVDTAELLRNSAQFQK